MKEIETTIVVIYKTQWTQTDTQNVRLRSANRGNANNAWYVNASGNVNNNNANNAYRCAPDCVVAALNWSIHRIDFVAIKSIKMIIHKEPVFHA